MTHSIRRHPISFAAFCLAIALSAAVLWSCATVHGATPVLRFAWTNPTTRGGVAGTFNPATDMLDAMACWGTTAGGPYPNCTTAPGAAVTVDVPYPATAGKYYGVVVIDGVDGTHSAPSAEASYTINAPADKATGVTISGH